MVGETGETLEPGEVAGGGDHIDEPVPQVLVEISDIVRRGTPRLGHMAGHHHETRRVPAAPGVSAVAELVDGVGAA